MCCSGKCDLSDCDKVVKLCVRIMDDQCKDEEWNKEKLLSHLKNKLIKANSNCRVTDEIYDKECDEIIIHGTLSQIVISKLLKNGLTKEDIITIMKYGLESNKFKHLNYCHIFNSDEKTINEELIGRLKKAGFSDEESSDIILNGLAYQNECYLFRLSSHNIFATKILNWQGRMSIALDSIVKFLEKLGMDEHTLKIVSEKGISAEAKEIIESLGYCESIQRIPLENIQLQDSICDCMDKIDEEKSDSIKSIPKCCIIPSSTSSRESDKRINFIRQNLMAPLIWAMSETLKYNPTDPIHYIGYQLLRWKHNNVEPLEMKKITDLVGNTKEND